MSVIFASFLMSISLIICAITLIAACCYIIDRYDEGWKGALHSGLMIISLITSIYLGVWLTNNTCEVRCNECQTEWVATSNDNNYCHVCGTKLERRN